MDDDDGIGIRGSSSGVVVVSIFKSSRGLKPPFAALSFLRVASDSDPGTVGSDPHTTPVSIRAPLLCEFSHSPDCFRHFFAIMKSSSFVFAKQRSVLWLVMPQCRRLLIPKDFWLFRRESCRAGRRARFATVAGCEGEVPGQVRP